MSETPCLIYDDPREIEAIWFPGEDAAGYKVGQLSTSRIVAYREHGPGDWIPYFAVYVGDDIKARIPGFMVSVHYAKAAA